MKRNGQLWQTAVKDVLSRDDNDLRGTLRPSILRRNPSNSNHNNTNDEPFHLTTAIKSECVNDVGDLRKTIPGLSATPYYGRPNSLFSDKKSNASASTSSASTGYQSPTVAKQSPAEVKPYSNFQLDDEPSSSLAVAADDNQSLPADLPCAYIYSTDNQIGKHLLNRIERRDIVKKKVSQAKKNMMNYSLTLLRESGVPLPRMNLYCKYCNMLCNSTEQYDRHVRGLAHREKMRDMFAGLQKREGTDICPLCGVDTHGMMDYHQQSPQHMKAVADMSVLMNDNQIEFEPSIESDLLSPHGTAFAQQTDAAGQTAAMYPGSSHSSSIY